MRSSALASITISARPGYWGAEPGGGERDVRVIRNGDIDAKGGIQWERLPLRGLSETEVSKARIEAEDILLTVSGDCGYVAYVPTPPSHETCATNFIRVLRCDTAQIAPRYLFHWMNRPSFRASLQPFVRGTTMKNLAVGDAFARLKVPLPSIGEQRRIASMLDEAVAVHHKHAAEVSRILSLLDSAFLEIFGDPIRPEEAWPRTVIGELGRVITGNTPSRSDPTNYGSAVGWAKNDDVRSDRLYTQRPAEGLSDIGIARARLAPAGSVLVTCISGSPAAIGRVALTDQTLAFNQQINAIVPTDIDGRFLCSQLRLMRPVLRHASTGGMKGLIKKTALEQIPVITPPATEQTRFGSIFDEVASQLQQLERHGDALQALVASLQYEAFERAGLS